MAGDRIFAVSVPASQGDGSTSIIELSWQSDLEKLQIVNRYNISTNDEVTEGLAYIPGEDGGSLCVNEGDTQLALYAIPPRIRVITSSTPTELPKQDVLNKKMLVSGLVDGHIASLYNFEGVLYVLHDNDMVVRSWDMDSGDMLSEFPLPHVGPEAGGRWKGLALTRNDGSVPALSSALRGQHSPLLLHLVLDSPPQVWSIAVDEGDNSKGLAFPPCAGV